MQDKLLAEFPDVSYETWREQVQKDLKGADFDKRLVTRTLEGIVVQPLYTAGDVVSSSDRDPGGFAGLPPYQRGAHSVGSYGPRWDVRAEQRAPELERAKIDIAEDLSGGAHSLWLRFDAGARLGSSEASVADGLICRNSTELAALLADVDLAQLNVTFDAGGNAAALAALYLAVADQRGIQRSDLKGSLGNDPLGAFARDGALPHGLPVARSLFGELARYLAEQAPQLRAAQVSTLPYHDAGASGTQELAYALATGLEYLRWGTDAGLSINASSAQLGFSIGVAGDLFLEIAKLRALRLCWAKLVTACGGDASAQNTRVHAVTSQRTKTQRDPWVNMLRTTTESFAAMAGGAEALTTRGFDELLGVSDSFARRIARNAQTILNEEAHVTHVADVGGGSYYIDSLTDALARGAWTMFQEIEQRGGMAAALSSGSIAKEIAEIASQRAAAVAKRSTAILGVSEFANLTEEPVVRPVPEAKSTRNATATAQPTAALDKISAANKGERIASAVDAARQGASLDRLTAALSGSGASLRGEALPVRRQAEPFEALRARSERQTRTGNKPRAFLCNLGAIPQHKARASFATGFLNAGGIAVIDNEGFASPELAAAAFKAAGTPLCVICGSDDQYPDWIAKLALLLRAEGATQILLAGRPGKHEVAFKEQGVSNFIYMGVDVVATLSQLLDRMGVAS